MKFSVLRGLTTTNGTNGVLLTSSMDNLLAGVNASGHTTGIKLDDSSNNLLSGITVFDNFNYGVHLLLSSGGNTLSNVRAHSNALGGVFLEDSGNNTLSNLILAKNGSSLITFGIKLKSSDNNRLSNIIVSSTFGHGVWLLGSSDNMFVNFTVHATTSLSGFFFDASPNNWLANVTLHRNGKGVRVLTASSNNTFMNIAATVNIGFANFMLEFGADSTTLSNLAFANKGGGVGILIQSSSNTFTGLLKVGNQFDDCSATGGTQGLDTDCAPTGTSDFTLSTGIDMADTFVFRVTTDDAANKSDTDGAAATFPATPSLFDWTSFDNPYRGWADDINGLRWVTGAAGRIWDYSLKSGDTGDPHTADQTPVAGPVALGVLGDPNDSDPIPDGDDFLTHTWSGSTTDYLLNAVEILGDKDSSGAMIGNDDGLCETDEHCLFTPNISSYQGHGALISAGAFDDSASGGLTGITLWKYENNGY